MLQLLKKEYIDDEYFTAVQARAGYFLTRKQQPQQQQTSQQATQQVEKKASPAAKKVEAEPKKEDFHLDVSDDESDFNLSDDDDDDEAAKLIKQRKEEALAKVLAKAANKPKARSSIIWDVKPEDDETDMAALEKGVRNISMDGLEWQGSELVPVAYGISKLRIISQIVDDDVPTDDLQEAIEAIEGVQSTDIFAFNKV